MKKNVILILLTVFCANTANSQLQRPPVSKFTPSEFGQQYSPNALSVAQDSNGVIYMGSVSGILQFDGLSWSSISVKTGNYITALAVTQNKIYIGGIGELGYLQVNKYGKYEYVSFLEKLEGLNIELTRVWSVLTWNKSVVFQTQEALLFYTNNSFTVVKPETSFHLAFTCENELYVRERGKGLLRFDGNRFVPVVGGNIFAEVGVFSVIAASDSIKVFFTQEIGQWQYYKNKFSKLKLDNYVEQLLSHSQIVGAIKLDDSNYAIYTLKNGVVILNTKFEFVANYNVNTGLLSSEIFNLIQDMSGDLWVATSKGLNRIQYSSPFSIFNQTHGLFGDVQSVAKTNSKLIVGTTQGLYESSTEGIKAFTEVDGVVGSVWAIEQTPNGYWIGAENDLWFYNGTKYSRINRSQSSALLYIPKFNWLVSAGNMGLQVFNSQTNELVLTQKDIRIDAYGMAYTFLKNGDCEIWIGSKTSGAWQVHLSPELRTAKYDVYGELDGLRGEDWICPYQFGQKVLFASPKELLRFITAEELFLMANDPSLKIEDSRGMFAPVDFPKGVFDKAITSFYYNAQTSYIGLDYNVNMVSMKDSIASDYYFKSLQVGKINAIKQFDDKLLIAARDGLVIANIKEFGTRKYPVPNLLLRSLTIGVDSVIWWGDAPIGDREIVIPYSLNNLKVNLSSAYFDNGKTAEYSWKFRSDNKGFSQWSTMASVSLSNLREGSYEFVAVARNIHGELSNEVTFRFEVLPPWYRTILAYVIYAVIAILVVYLFVQGNIKRLKAQNKRLEEIVKQRTKEVVEQKEHIEKQKEHIEDILKDIRSSINYAQRIQQAMLPSRELFDKVLPGHFIIFYPRDIVSGDFYWAIKVKDWVVVTVADCTGHGVPGAFMSMLGISFLNEIVGKKGVLVPSQILSEMRQAIVDALKQSSEHQSQKDGMDMSIVAVNLKTLACRWAGANNPLYIVRKNGIADEANLEENKKRKVTTFDCCTLIELKQDRMPVAIHTVMEDFTSHEIQLVEGDRLYMFSDGYVDQFGGADYRKFMAKAFKELVVTTSSVPIAQQGFEVEQAFKNWVNFKDLHHEQIDDVTVLGFEV